MALFNSQKDQKIKRLEHENEELQKEVLDWMEQKYAVEHEYAVKVARLEKKICTECGLSPEQIAHVRFIFSIEWARINGVPEDRILHSIDEINTFFAGES